MNPNFISSIQKDPDYEVQDLFLKAKKRKEDMMKYHLLGELLNGNVVDVTKSPQLYEALNREKMDFEQILNLHPEEVAAEIEYVKQRRIEQNGIWWNNKSQARSGEKGVIPPCCYYARPKEYWKNKHLTDNFLNTFSKFRISEKAL